MKKSSFQLQLIVMVLDNTQLNYHKTEFEDSNLKQSMQTQRRTPPETLKEEAIVVIKLDFVDMPRCLIYLSEIRKGRGNEWW